MSYRRFGDYLNILSIFNRLSQFGSPTLGARQIRISNILYKQLQRPTKNSVESLPAHLQPRNIDGSKTAALWKKNWFLSLKYSFLKISVRASKPTLRESTFSFDNSPPGGATNKIFFREGRARPRQHRPGAQPPWATRLGRNKARKLGVPASSQNRMPKFAENRSCYDAAVELLHMWSVGSNLPYCRTNVWYQYNWSLLSPTPPSHTTNLETRLNLLIVPEFLDRSVRYRRWCNVTSFLLTFTWRRRDHCWFYYKS